MRSDNICFHREIKKIVPKLPLFFDLIGSYQEENYCLAVPVFSIELAPLWVCRKMVTNYCQIYLAALQGEYYSYCILVCMIDDRSNKWLKISFRACCTVFLK